MKLKKMKKTKIIIKKNVIYNIVTNTHQYLIKASKDDINEITGIAYNYCKGKFIKYNRPIRIVFEGSSTFITISIAKPSFVRLSPFYDVVDKCLDIINQIENGNN